MSQNLTPAERSMRARLGAHSQWARTEDRAARTAAARAGFQKRFENQVDPDGVLEPAERAKRVVHARQEHMLRMAMASAKARRLRAQLADIEAALADDGADDEDGVATATHSNTEQHGGAVVEDVGVAETGDRVSTAPHPVHGDGPVEL